MEKLKAKILRRKTDVFEYRLIKRSQFVAMYAQVYTDADVPRIVSYEVFLVERQKAGERMIGGAKVKFIEKEKFPNDEAFGYTAWSIVDVKKAEAKFEELTGMAHKMDRFKDYVLN